MEPPPSRGPRLATPLQRALRGRERDRAEHPTTARAARVGADRFGDPYSERPPRFAYALTDEGSELAGALRLLADWGSRVSRESEPLRHAACGTPVEARWYCPTCDRPVEGQEAEQVRRV